MKKENKILYGKPVVENIMESLKEKAAVLKKEGIVPTLYIISVGDDPASKTYIKGKLKKAEEVGILAENIILDGNIDQATLNSHTSYYGSLKNGVCILQLPLPNHLDAKEAMDKIDHSCDADGLTTESIGRLWNDTDCFEPATAKGIISLLDFYNIDLEGKDVCIVNRSSLIGKPLAKMMMDHNATVTICHSRTKDLKAHTKRADVVVLGVGRAKMFDSSYFSDNAIIIDCGINRDENNKLCGDLNIQSIEEDKEGIMYTPTPAGTGLCTSVSIVASAVEKFIK